MRSLNRMETWMFESWSGYVHTHPLWSRAMRTGPLPLVNAIIENALSKPPDAVGLAHDLQCTMTTAERHELMSHLFQIVAADGTLS